MVLTDLFQAIYYSAYEFWGLSFRYLTLPVTPWGNQVPNSGFMEAESYFLHIAKPKLDVLKMPFSLFQNLNLSRRHCNKICNQN